MNFAGKLWRRFWFLFRRAQFERDLQEEIHLHLEMKAQACADAGLSPEEARYAARRSFGNPALLMEESRDAWIIRWWEALLQDLRFGGRLLRKNPGFALVAIATLALGIGANTAIFSVFHAVVLRPLPFPESERLVRIEERHSGGRPINLTGATFHDLRASNRAFSGVSAYRLSPLNFSDGAVAQQVTGAFVSEDFLQLLRTPPVVGRAFESGDYLKGGKAVTVIGHALWQQRFGSNPGAVGRSVLLHGRPHRIVGVMPRGFAFPDQADLWSPLTSDRGFAQNRRSHLFTVVARVRAGISLEQARADLVSVAAQVQSENPGVDPDATLEAEQLQRRMVAAVKPSLLVLLGAVGLVLLVACSNAANLLLAHAAARRRELAVRAALGAGRARLMRQFIAENVLLAALSGAAGLLLGMWAVRLIVALYPGPLPGLATVSMDGIVVLFTAGLSLATAMLFGALPAMQAGGPDLNVSLSAGARSSAGPRGRRVRAGLVVSQLALGLVLLVGAGLLMQSFVRLQRVHSGYDPRNLLTAAMSLPNETYPEAAQETEFCRAVLERVSALPGVRAAAFANSRPSTGGPWTDFELQGRQFGPGEEPTATVLAVSDDYFRALGIRLVKGRTFTDADRSSAPVAMVINEAMARRYWPGENVIGRQAVMKDWDEPLPGEVVGVVSDVRQDGLEAPAPPIVYYSQRQFGRGALAYYLLVKTEGDPLLLAGAVRAQVAEVDRSLPVSDLATMEQVLAASMASRRFNLVLIAVFAALALVLATIGVYGVMSYTVGLRRQEIAIRMALGAQRATVLKLVMGQAGRLVLAGALAGVLAALAFTRMMKSLLFGIGAADPATFAAVALLIGGVAMFASYLPARRAARVDPMRALHYE